MKMKIDIEKLKKIEEACGQFEIGRIMGGGDHNYLRFGYWKPTDLDKLTEILGPSIVVEEDSDYDDDCGWKYSYTLYDRYEWGEIKRKREASWCNYSGMPSPTAYAEKKS
jgi:hypothetical protein